MSDPVKVKFVTGDFSHYDIHNYEEGTLYYLVDRSVYPNKNRIFLNGKEYTYVNSSDVYLAGQIVATHDVGGITKSTVISPRATLLNLLTIILSGEIHSSTYDIETRRVINVVDPVNAQDAATKNYADSCALVWQGLT